MSETETHVTERLGPSTGAGGRGIIFSLTGACSAAVPVPDALGVDR